MKIRFVEWTYPEEYDFKAILRNAGLAHEVDSDEVMERVYDGGTRELKLNLELDTETGIITVVSSS